MLLIKNNYNVTNQKISILDINVILLKKCRGAVGWTNYQKCDIQNICLNISVAIRIHLSNGCLGKIPTHKHMQSDLTHQIVCHISLEICNSKLTMYGRSIANGCVILLITVQCNKTMSLFFIQLVKGHLRVMVMVLDLLHILGPCRTMAMSSSRQSH